MYFRIVNKWDIVFLECAFYRRRDVGVVGCVDEYGSESIVHFGSTQTQMKGRIYAGKFGVCKAKHGWWQKLSDHSWAIVIEIVTVQIMSSFKF